MDKISVIIPVYNTKCEYLKECIESVKKQTYGNIEILIIDYGSDKHTAELCDEIQKQDNRIVVIHKKNEGVSAARNLGIEKATGEWICFVDSDDWLETDSFECLLKNSKDKDLVIANIFIDNKKIENEITIENVDEKERKKIISCLLAATTSKYLYLDVVWWKLYKKDTLLKENVKFTVGIPRGEDTLFNLKVLKKFDKIGFSAKCMYHYRTNNESVTNKYDDNIVRKYNSLIIEIKKNIKSLLGVEYEDDYYAFVIRCLDNACKSYIYNINNKMNNKEKANFIKELSKSKEYSSAIKNIKLKYVSKKKKLLIILIRLNLFRIIRFIYN